MTSTTIDDTDFICRRDAAKRAEISPQLLDYWMEKHPSLLKHHGDCGRVFVSKSALDDIVAARLMLKGRKVRP